MMHRDDTDDLDLLALADGLLDDDPVRKAELEQAVARCPRASARLADYRAQTAALRAAYAGVLAEPVPDRLYAVVERAGRSRARPALQRAVAAVLIVAAAVGGWMVGQDGDDPARQALLDESYRQFAFGGTDGMVAAADVAMNAAEPAISWIDEDVAIRLSAPDLSSEGFTLVEKRGLRRSGDQIVALDYASADGRSFSLFLAPRWANRPGPIVEDERDGVTLTYWHDGPLASSIATELPRDEARHLAQTVRRAMRDETTAPPPSLRPNLSPDPSPPGGVMADSTATRPDAAAADADAVPAPATVVPN